MEEIEGINEQTGDAGAARCDACLPRLA